MDTSSLVLGTIYGQQHRLAAINPRDFLHHMLIVGQSGSGKSFFIARLIEEILLRTKARVVVIDPNGDFRRLSDAAASTFWTAFERPFARLAELCEKSGLPVFDHEENFRKAWDTRRFQYVIANPDRGPRPLAFNPSVMQSDLFVHWAFVSSDEQDFLIDLLNVDPVVKTKINLGVRACNEYLERLVAEQQLPQGYGLLEVIRVADKFGTRDINLADYPYAKALTAEDWSIVSGNLQQLYFRHLWMWWNSVAQGWDGNWNAPPRRTDMLGYLLRPFSRVERPDRWNACIIGLDKARIDDGLLAVNLALFRLWNSSQHQWRNVESDNNPGNDPRVPTFIVIDEAHNYAPTEHRNAVQKRVTDKLIQIAAEGRKYGLYLILATQRPRKLHPHLVLECENCCLLRIQSKVEQEFLEKEFGIPHEEAGRIGKYEKGHALFHGRWMEGKQVEAAVAPARTIVGGGGVPDSWMAAPSFDTAMVFETQGGGAVEDVAEPGLHGGSDGAVASMPRREDHLVTRIQEVVRQAVEESLVPVSLSALGLKIRDLFGNEIIEATQWFGYLNLSALVRALNDEHVVYSPVGTGFVLDPSRHHEPIDEDVVDRVARVAPDYASLAARLHYEARIPLLAPGEYGVVFQIIVEEIRQNGFAMSQTAKAVRDQAKLSGVQLTRPGVNFILARLYSAGYSFEKTETAHLEAAGILAQRFTAGVVAFCEGIGMKLTTGDQEMIAKWVNDDLTSNPSGSAEQTP